MRKPILTLLILSLYFIPSYSQVFGKVYEIDSLETIVKLHKSVAVIPFVYKLSLKKMPKGMTQDDIVREEEKGSLSAQTSFYTYALEKIEKNNATVEFQDVNRTKVLLEREKINEKNINNYLPEELCKILGVDALITGEIIASKPMSEGAAIATTLLIGYSKTNQAKTTVKVYEKGGKLIWSYGKEVAGGLGSDDSDMIRILMRKTAKRFPYFKD